MEGLRDNRCMLGVHLDGWMVSVLMMLRCWYPFSRKAWIDREPLLFVRQQRLETKTSPMFWQNWSHMLQLMIYVTSCIDTAMVYLSLTIQGRPWSINYIAIFLGCFLDIKNVARKLDEVSLSNFSCHNWHHMIEGTNTTVQYYLSCLQYPFYRNRTSYYYTCAMFASNGAVCMRVILVSFF